MGAPFGSHNLQTFGYSFMSCKLRVDTRSSGWQRTVRKVLSGIRGVYNFKMDVDGLVQVSGMIDPYVLLNKIGKAGNRAELVWLQYGDCSSYLDMPPPPFTPRRDDPCYAYGGYCGGGGGLGNNGDYKGQSGYWDYCLPPPSHRPFSRLGPCIDPLQRRTFSGWN